MDDNVVYYVPSSGEEEISGGECQALVTVTSTIQKVSNDTEYHQDVMAAKDHSDSCDATDEVNLGRYNKRKVIDTDSSDECDSSAAKRAKPSQEGDLIECTAQENDVDRHGMMAVIITDVRTVVAYEDSEYNTPASPVNEQKDKECDSKEKINGYTQITDDEAHDPEEMQRMFQEYYTRRGTRLPNKSDYDDNEKGRKLRACESHSIMDCDCIWSDDATDGDNYDNEKEKDKEYHDVIISRQENKDIPEFTEEELSAYLANVDYHISDSDSEDESQSYDLKHQNGHASFESIHFLGLNGDKGEDGDESNSCSEADSYGSCFAFDMEPYRLALGQTAKQKKIWRNKV